MRAFLFGLFLLFGTSVQAQVTGYIDRVDEVKEGALVKGWACVKGLNENIEVRLFSGGKAGTGKLLKVENTNVASSSQIHSICKTSKTQKHRFSILIPSNLLKKYYGQKVYIHGINPKGKNLLINRSGLYTLPKESLLSKNTTSPKKPVSPSKEPRPSKEPMKNISVLSDLLFNRGVQVKSPEIDIEYTGDYYMLNGIRCQSYRDVWTRKTHNIYFANSNQGDEPKWALAQWGSKSNLLAANGSFVNKGTFAWQNLYKIFQIGKLGYGYRGITLGINGYEEYNKKWYVGNDPCVETPHPQLLLGQGLSADSRSSLKGLKKLLFTFKARILTEYLPQSLYAGWNKKTNTAHVKIHFNFQNIRADKNVEKGHGQSFGVAVNFFDVRNRDADYAEKVFFHRPRRRIILNLSVDDLGKNIRANLHAGGWGVIDQKDMLPMVKKAFKYAVDIGKKDQAIERLKSENLNDYYLTNFNTGWEVSSPHIVEIHISDLNLVGQK